MFLNIELFWFCKDIFPFQIDSNSHFITFTLFKVYILVFLVCSELCKAPLSILKCFHHTERNATSPAFVLTMVCPFVSSSLHSAKCVPQCALLQLILLLCLVTPFVVLVIWPTCSLIGFASHLWGGTRPGTVLCVCFPGPGSVWI